MSTKDQTTDKPHAPVRGTQPVNHRDSWRFRCPEFHTCLEWCSREKVFCPGCKHNGLETGVIPVDKIVDQKTGRTLADFLENRP